jgi:anaerobic selenocysteine-containing dehydrogenase
VLSEGDEIVAIDHPECVRAESMFEQRESPERWTTPRIRNTNEDPWRDVSWDEALSTTANALNGIRDTYGPESVVFAVGYTKEVRPYLKRLAQTFGSPHYVTESSCCFGSGFVAATVTLGKEYEYFLGPSRRRCPETKCRLVWSGNPTESQIPYDAHHHLVDAPQVPTIVVDPRRTRLAEVAAIHLQNRPGTDGALALGMAHVLFEENLQDQAFLDAYSHGLDEYKRYITYFTPDKTGRITDIPAEKIVEAARLYGRLRPAQIAISPCATVHHSNGFQAHRAILLLAAICGNLDVEGGNRPWTERFKEASIGIETSTDVSRSMGALDFPLFTRIYGEAQGMLLAEAIELERVKAVFAIGMNVMMWPNSGRLRNALDMLELFAVSDFFTSPTVDAANVFFPAATHLERQALVTAGVGRVQYRPAAVRPRGEARGDTELVFDLARHLGLGGQFWSGDIQASITDRLEGSGMRFEDLPENGSSIQLEIDLPEERAYETQGFGTPTGKVEFVSTEMEKVGLNGLPFYEEPFWSPVSTPEIAEEYPLILTSGGRTRNYTHSQSRFLKTARDREPQPRVQIHPADAEARRVGEGDWVDVTSPLGVIEMKAWVTDIVPPGVVHAFHGWAGHNINELIPDDGLDPVSGFPPFRSSLCQVRKK